jgi:hypothetical protein
MSNPTPTRHEGARSLSIEGRARIDGKYTELETTRVDLS